MKAFISGKITGDSDYRARFKAAERVLEYLGYAVLNPATLPKGMGPHDYGRICLAMIDTADAVFFLPGWEKSPGASLEHTYCGYTGKTVHEFTDAICMKAWSAGRVTPDEVRKVLGFPPTVPRMDDDRKESGLLTDE